MKTKFKKNQLICSDTCDYCLYLLGNSTQNSHPGDHRHFNSKKELITFLRAKNLGHLKKNITYANNSSLLRKNTVVLQIPINLLEKSLPHIRDLNPTSIKIQFLICSDSRISSATKSSLEKLKHFSLLFLSSKDPIANLLRLKDIPLSLHKNLYFFFPFHPHEKEKSIQDCDVFYFLKICKQSFKNLKIRPFPGLEFLDESHPYTHPQIINSYRLGNTVANPNFSIIIPSFNNQEECLECVSNLIKNSSSEKKLQLILIIDGSTDQTIQKLLEHSPLQSTTHEILIIELKKRAPETSGYFDFRSGIARNIGVHFSNSKNLLFVDSDILIHPDTFLEIENLASSYDLIQFKRRHLKPNTITENINLKSIPKNQLKFRHHDAGNSLYNLKNGEEWNDIPNPWYFVSTYCLYMTKNNFLKAGGFSENFRHYGFEDVDLGYRLKKKLNTTFYISNKSCYHIYPKNETHSFAQNEFKKYQVLKKSIRIFFRTHLDPHIFSSARFFFDT